MLVSKYYGFTFNYIYGVLDNYSHSTFLTKKKICAFKVIKYLEEDEAIDKTSEPIAEFIKKWKDWELEQDVYPHSSLYKQK